MGALPPKFTLSGAKLCVVIPVCTRWLSKGEPSRVRGMCAYSLTLSCCMVFSCDASSS